MKQPIKEDSLLTESDKAKLLDYLRQSQGGKATKDKITLTRTKTTQIKKSDLNFEPLAEFLVEEGAVSYTHLTLPTNREV